MSAEPLTREERDALRARCLRDIEHRRLIGMTRETVEVDHLLSLLADGERAERLRVALEESYEFIDRVKEWIGSDPDELHEVIDMVLSALAADDAARGDS